MPRLLRILASAALLVSAATLLSRIVGVLRWVVFSPNVGAGAVGTAYQSANLVPNILFEVVAGGALAGAVVPLLAGPLARKSTAEASAIASALLTWAVALMLPLAVLVALLRAPIAAALVGAGRPETAFAEDFLLMFAPQLVLYAVGAVLTGVLQAHRRFLWPALMPLLSSLVVIGCYAGYGASGGGGAQDATPSALALLGWGTTAGVAALALPLALPTARTGLRIRPRLRFPGDAGARALRLAGAGMAVLLAQQIANLVVMLVANRSGGTGAFVVFSYVQAVYMLPYAVLAVPVATVVFPTLSSLAARVREGGADASDDEVDAVISRTTGIVCALGLLGAAVLVAAAAPLGAFFSGFDAARASDSGDGPLAHMALAVAVISLAVPGWCLVAWGTRVFYALERSRTAATATAAGWAVTAASLVVGALILAARPELAASPAQGTLVLISLSFAFGMTVAGAGLLVGIGRLRGRGALAGALRRLLVLLPVAAASAVVGALTASAASAAAGGLPQTPAALLAGIAAGLAAVAVFAVGALLVDWRLVSDLAHLR